MPKLYEAAYELSHHQNGLAWYGFRRLGDPLDVYRDHFFQVAIAWEPTGPALWVVDPTGLETLKSFYRVTKPGVEVVINLLNPVALIR